MPQTSHDPDDDVETTETHQSRQMKKPQKRENPATEIRGVQDKYLATWATPDGISRRQIGAIMINAKYRKADQKEQIIIQWQANMNQNRPRRVQKMKRYYNAAKKYKAPIPSETGEKLKYDIHELRIRPELFDKWHQCRDDEKKCKAGRRKEKTKKENETQDWAR